MTDPRRLLDDGSAASPALRALLASAKREDDPRAPQIEALSARLAASVAPPSPIAPMALAPHVVATAVASASRLAIGIKAGAVIVALGVLCGGAWYVRTIRDAEHTQADTRPAIELDARPTPATVAPRAPDQASIESVAAQPSPTPSPDSASALPRPAASPRQPRGSGDGEAETKLVVAAGAALVRDDPEAALALTRQHLAQFPNGAHAEERDRIAIEALARLGGFERARTAADRFFIRYPESIYRSRIESLLR
jgi:hypothetical protein